MNGEHDRVILLCICGGVAAYKAVEVASGLRKLGKEVRVAMTDAAQKFVTPLTFAAVTGNPVLQTQFPDAAQAGGESLYPHLYPATRAGVCVILPATANMIAQIANGLARDVVSTAALSLPRECRRYFCPAMNVEMWDQPMVQENVARMEKHGWIRIGPNSGSLACGMEGVGRMAEPAEIIAQIARTESRESSRSKPRILILSGPTHEYLDPVRFIGNASSGRMGRALAEIAAEAGSKIDFVTGPVPESHLPRTAKITIHSVTTADEMLKKAKTLYAKADLILYAAAVADYRPANPSRQKLPKEKGGVALELVPTPDLAATLNAGKRANQVAVGFALQTNDGLAKAKEKLAQKRLDGIVLNGLDALGGDSGTYTFIAASGRGAPRVEEWGALTKQNCAQRILAEGVARLAAVSG